MSPERLFRHDHPPDSEPMLWGDARTIAEVAAGAIRHAYWLAALAITLTLFTGIATAYLSVRADNNRHAIEQSSCTFINVLEDSETRERALANTGSLADKNAHLASADRLAHYVSRARATGIHCPPP
jgi:hypothetical protein